jgi:hypothetical protein
MSTPLNKQAEILSDLWLNYRSDEDFRDFIEYNDLGLPLAYALSAGIIQPTEKVQSFVEETFMLLLSGMEIEEDEGFDNLNDIIDKFIDEE